MVSQVISQFIPNQRLERIASFLKELEKSFAQFDQRLSQIESHITSTEGLDIFEEGMLQAARSASEDRQRWLAAIVGNSLSSEKMKYEESKKLLNLYRELTDGELIWLIYISKTQTLNSSYHKALREKYPDILKTASKEVGASQDESDRSALQDGYKNTLLRLGLATLKDNGKTLQITQLGSLLVRYLRSDDNEKDS
jgi:hypothetical protein